MLSLLTLLALVLIITLLIPIIFTLKIKENSSESKKSVKKMKLTNMNKKLEIVITYCKNNKWQMTKDLTYAVIMKIVASKIVDSSDSKHPTGCLMIIMHN